MNDTELADHREAYEQLKRRPDIDPRRIAPFDRVNVSRQEGVPAPAATLYHEPAEDYERLAYQPVQKESRRRDRSGEVAWPA